MITLASSVRWTSSPPAIYLTYEYEKQRSGAAMQYRARITVSTVTGASSFGYPIYATVTINGETAGSATIKAANPSQWSSALVYTTPWVTVSNKTTGTTPISFRVYSGSGSSRNQTNSYSMAVDPAASLISASNGTLGTAQTIALTKYESSFTSTISYTCGTASGTVATRTAASSISFTPPISLATQNTTGSNVAITITATTYTSAGLEVGSNSVVISAAIPASVKPSASIAVSDSTSNYSKYGAYVQGQSALSITLAGTPSQNAPISTYFISADGKTFSTQTALVSPIGGSGTLTVSGYVTDTRGRQSSTASRSITVLPYTAPRIDSVSMQRCNANGTQNHLGAYIKVTFTASVSALSNENTARYVLQYKPQTASSYTSVTLSSYTNQYSVSNGSYIFAATADTGYNVQLVVTDDFKTSTRTAQAATGEVAMHFLSTKDGAAFGKYAETQNLLDINWDARVRGDLTLDGDVKGDVNITGEATAGSIKATGAMSANSSTIMNGLTAKSITASESVTSGRASVTGKLTAGSAEVTGALKANGFDFGTNKVLWSGDIYMTGTQTADLSEPISEQPHGVVLIFGFYSDSTSKNEQFSCHFVPKAFIELCNGYGINFFIGGQWHMAAKYLYFTDSVISGNASNSVNSTVGNVTLENRSFVLRYVIGV